MSLELLGMVNVNCTPLGERIAIDPCPGLVDLSKYYNVDLALGNPYPVEFYPPYIVSQLIEGYLRIPAWQHTPIIATIIDNLHTGIMVTGGDIMTVRNTLSAGQDAYNSTSSKEGAYALASIIEYFSVLCAYDNAVIFLITSRYK